MSDSKITIAGIAPQIAGIAPQQVTGNRPEGSLLFFFNPASGAIEVRTDARDKVARSLVRHARRMKRSLFFLKLRLQVEYFSLYARRAAFVALRNLFRFREKLVRDSHDNSN
jgi:hypothetical protein